MKIEQINICERETAEEVWRLQHAAYRAEAALIGVSSLPPLQDTTESLQKCGERFFGCRLSVDELAGAISCLREGDSRYVLCRLMVHPHYFRQGIGNALLARLLAETPSNATWTVTAEIRNLPALALYARYGFIQVETCQLAPDITLATLQRLPQRFPSQGDMETAT